MADRANLHRFLDRTENLEFPLRALEAVRELRRYLADVEREALGEARNRGASAQDIADALGITRQAVYYKLGQRGAEGPERTAEPDVIEIPDVEPSASADEPKPRSEEASGTGPLIVGPATIGPAELAMGSGPVGSAQGF